MKVELGWLALVIPVAVGAIGVIVRAFGAEDRVRRDCHEPATQVRDAVLLAGIRPTLATIIVKIHPYMSWPDPGTYLPGEPGDPQLEGERVLGYRQAAFSDSVSALEDQFAKVHRARSVHGRRVAGARRAGVAMAVFLAAWLYLAVWLMVPAADLPTWLSVAAVGVLAASGGWAAAEWWGSTRETNALSILAREAAAESQGDTR